MLLLGLINAYMFVWREDSSIGGLAGLQAASVGSGGGPLPALADPPSHGCGGDPVRVFEGLEHLIVLDADLSGGSTLRLALLGVGVLPDEIDRIEASVRSKVDLSLLAGSSAPMRVASDRFGSVHALEIELAEGHVLQACREGEAFEVRNIQHPLRIEYEVVGLTLAKDASLAAAVAAAQEQPELAHLVAKTLAHDIDFTIEARPGDRVQVMVEKRWLGRRFHRYGPVAAIRFRGAVGRVQYFRYKPEGQPAAFFDHKGRPMQRELLRSPVAYHRVNPDARALLEPSVEVVASRKGVVYRLPQGAPLVALAAGEIREVDRTVEEGNFIDLELESGMVLRYSHLMRVVGELTPGTKVCQGQVIGLAGHSGRTPNDRLRLEVWTSEGPDMETIDPVMFVSRASQRPEPVGPSIPKPQLSAYADDIAARRRSLRFSR